MTHLEQLAEKAKQAQRDYDKAVRDEAKSRAESIPKGTLVATSTKEGFEWKCNTDGKAIVRHVSATISSAMQTFNSQTAEEAGLNKIMLAIAIKNEMEKLMEVEAND